MKCSGEFVFRSIEKKDGGEFVNQNNEKVSYTGSYQIKVDEIEESSVNERKFKISLTEKNLVEKFKQLEAYEKVTIWFNINFYSNNVKLIPIDVDVVD